MAILKLRDEERVSLDAPAEQYVPELRNWRYPTADSRRTRVADLLHHTAGLVEDNPWGDRQQPLSEPAFTAMLKAGVPLAQAPGLRMEYSNLGYATLGRIVSNVSGQRYQDYIRSSIMTPLGMTSTGYDVLNGPQDLRALGYRWQDNAWVREPDMADGAFGAMGGVQTTANDYWRWVAFLLSAWPARDDPDKGPIKRATVREIVEGSNFVNTVERPGASGRPCRVASAYGMGSLVVNDCDVGRIVTHSGGYPGYGSIVMLLPDAGVGVFAFANRTYAGPGLPVSQTLYALRQAGLAEERTVPVSPDLARAYDIMRDVWRSGDPARDRARSALHRFGPRPELPRPVKRAAHDEAAVGRERGVGDAALVRAHRLEPAAHLQRRVPRAHRAVKGRGEQPRAGVRPPVAGAAKRDRGD
jgi:CubicO group peptidase (beta-lactamase class C family)